MGEADIPSATFDTILTLDFGSQYVRTNSIKRCNASDLARLI